MLGDLFGKRFARLTLNDFEEGDAEDLLEARVRY
jgi:hypothetical protein